MKFNGSPGLVLPGGGARAAYQVGVLKAISAVLDSGPVPFESIAGISAGALNAASLVQNADDFEQSVAKLERIWAEMRSDNVYTLEYNPFSAFMPMAKKGAALLDNSPLAKLLHEKIDTQLIKDAIDSGVVKGLAITASNYNTGEANTFFQAKPENLEWHHNRRDSIRTPITIEHLLASSALPLLFPPQAIGDDFFIDGSLRMTAPLSPVINLGADRILVIGVRNEARSEIDDRTRAPGIAEVAGYTLESLFNENLNADMEHTQHINDMLALVPWWRRKGVGRKKISVMVIRPSEDLRIIASRFSSSLPRSIRLFLRAMGGWGREWRLPSYLLFEPEFTQALIDLGYRDGLKMRPMLEEFFSS